MAETETIEPKEAREPIAAGELYVIDIRPQEMWEENSERLPGAVHIPGDQLASKLDELPDDTKILLVTPDGQGCEEVAESLGEEREVAILAGGVEAWRSARLMTQPSPDAEPPKDEGEEPVESPDDEDDDGDEDHDEDSDTSEGTSEDTSDDGEQPAPTTEGESK